MKNARAFRAAAAALSLAALAACVPRPAPPPPVPQARPAPLPEPSPPPPPVEWTEAPLSSGDWTFSLYGGRPQAAYGPAGTPQFLLRCEPGGRVTLLRVGAVTGNALTVSTTYGDRNLPAAVIAGPRPALASSLAATDPLLDAIVFSRGRFAIAAPGMAPLILPAWPEAARVVEECRI